MTDVQWAVFLIKVAKSFCKSWKDMAEECLILLTITRIPLVIKNK